MCASLCAVRTFPRMTSRLRVRVLRRIYGKICTKFSMALRAKLNLCTGCLHKSITLAKLVHAVNHKLHNDVKNAISIFCGVAMVFACTVTYGCKLGTKRGQSKKCFDIARLLVPLIFLGYFCIPDAEPTCPRYSTCSHARWHFTGLSRSPASRSRCNTACL